MDGQNLNFHLVIKVASHPKFLAGLMAKQCTVVVVLMLVVVVVVVGGLK